MYMHAYMCRHYGVLDKIYPFPARKLLDSGVVAERYREVSFGEICWMEAEEFLCQMKAEDVSLELTFIYKLLECVTSLL